MLSEATFRVESFVGLVFGEDEARVLFRGADLFRVKIRACPPNMDSSTFKSSGGFVGVSVSLGVASPGASSE